MLAAESLSQTYHGQTVLSDFSFRFSAGAIHGIIGPNGAGKSTLLRLLTATERPQGGKVFFHGEPLIKPVKSIGSVWQRPYLFQTTVAQNVAYGLKLNSWRPAALKARVDFLLELFNLSSLKNQWAPGLSGGEAARVAIARAVAAKPEVLILDEPAANLDPQNTALVEQVIAALNREEKMTVVMVTHDMFQAKRLASQTIFLNAGRLLEAGSTREIFNTPGCAELQHFLAGDLSIAGGDYAASSTC